MSLRTPAEMKMEPALTPIQPFPVEGKGFDPLLPSETVSQRMGSGVSSRTNVRDLRFLPAVEMTERLTQRCFRYCDTGLQRGRKEVGAPRRQERKKSFLDYATKPSDAAGRKPGKIRPTSLCPKWRTKTSLHTVR